MLNISIRWEKMHDRLAHDGLSASGLTNNAENFAGIDAQINTSNSLNLALRGIETYSKIV